ncbi:MAG: ABC transporter ATP-binding protein/permease [Hyphomicrobiales bacterium]|nr:ABC transporter ATP-binding protein/permease [Hyphomicrobiales bacterium]
MSAQISDLMNGSAMPENAGTAPAGDAGSAKSQSKPQPLRDFFGMASGFWRGRAKKRAWFLTIAVIVAVLAQISVQVFVNSWNKWFFDSLEQKNMPLVWRYVAMIVPMVLAAATVNTGLVLARMQLKMRWREWATRHLLGWWIADQRYYRLPFVAEELAAPEFRIADDVRLSIEPLVDFAIGIFTAGMTAATFATILWRAAGSIHLPIGAHGVDIPAYMAVAAVLYAIVISFGAWRTGRPLAREVAQKNQQEAEFRAQMTRLRENAESIALIKGDREERRALQGSYDNIVAAWKTIIRRQGIIGVVLNTNGGLFPLIPLLLIAPKYLAGDVSLGVVMQVTAAFVSVQAALIWFVDNFVSLSEWYASLTRVNELTDALEDVDIGSLAGESALIERGDSEDGAIHVDNLSVAHRSGRLIIADASVSISPGERVIIMGESGTGKSTLIRAIAGLWPWGSGEIRLPRNAQIAFVPQRPYMPIGSLRQLLIYPLETPPCDDAALIEAMNACGLNYMANRLDAEEDWDRILSGGERQRVAFARLFIQKPQIIVMDEATAALDEDSQQAALAALKERLPEAMVISVGHRPSLEAFHDRKIVLERRSAGARLRQRGGLFSLWNRWSGLEREFAPDEGPMPKAISELLSKIAAGEETKPPR